MLSELQIVCGLGEVLQHFVSLCEVRGPVSWQIGEGVKIAWSIYTGAWVAIREPDSANVLVALQDLKGNSQALESGAGKQPGDSGPHDDYRQISALENRGDAGRAAEPHLLSQQALILFGHGFTHACSQHFLQLSHVRIG